MFKSKSDEAAYPVVANHWIDEAVKPAMMDEVQINLIGTRFELSIHRLSRHSLSTIIGTAIAAEKIGCRSINPTIAAPPKTAMQHQKCTSPISDLFMVRYPEKHPAAFLPQTPRDMLRWLGR